MNGLIFKMESQDFTEEINKEAYLAAIKLLTKKDYSEYKLKQKLLDREYSPSEVDKVIEYLLEKNYLREDYYIEARVKGLMKKGLSPSAIKARLKKEHVETSYEIISEIFAEHQFTPQGQIEELIVKKIRLSHISDLFKLKEKIYRFLQSKGHNPSEFSHLVEEHISRLR